MIYSHTVRPDDADTGNPGFYQHLLFQFDRILPTGFSKAGGEEMDALTPLTAQSSSRFNTWAAGMEEMTKIDIAGDVTHRRITFESQDFLIFGMNRIYFSFKSSFTRERINRPPSPVSEAPAMAIDSGCSIASNGFGDMDYPPHMRACDIS